MKKDDILFVYGTLRLGEYADLSRMHPGKVEFLSTDCINGSLYALGHYPGVKYLRTSEGFKPSFPVVHGDLFRILDPSVVGAIDMYEGHPNLFTRIAAKTALGYDVFVYDYPHVVRNQPLIESGDWTTYMIPETPARKAPDLAPLAKDVIEAKTSQTEGVG